MVITVDLVHVLLGLPTRNQAVTAHQAITEASATLSITEHPPEFWAAVMLLPLVASPAPSPAEKHALSHHPYHQYWNRILSWNDGKRANGKEATTRTAWAKLILDSLQPPAAVQPPQTVQSAKAVKVAKPAKPAR